MAAAAVAIPPQQSNHMSSRRGPLANNPNAINSPYRGSATTLKRSRVTPNEGKEHGNQDSPPKKKLLLDAGIGVRRSYHNNADDREGRVFLDRGEPTPPNAFTKRLVAMRGASAAQPKASQRVETRSQADQETVKQWRKHYRKVFPTFVFYFESVPHDISIRATKQISHLGAREEKFFSRAVTHIVTTRPLPPSPSATEASDTTTSSFKTATSLQTQSSQRTINPSLLDKSAALQLAQSRSGKHALDAITQRRRDAAQLQETELRRHQSSNADVLLKGRELGMKIWPLEKFQRMMDTLLDSEFDELTAAQAQRRAPTTNAIDAKPEPEKLSELLRNEKNMGHDRLPLSEIIPFQGVYIYIHDINEKTKPVMVREFPKVANKEDGEWPQFRSVPLPRCPFVDDQMYTKEKDQETEKEERMEKKQQAADTQRTEARTRSASAAAEAARQKVDMGRSQKQIVRDVEPTANRMPKPPLPSTAKTFDPPPPIKIPASNNLDSMPPQLGSARLQFPGFLRPGREPMASGVQQSNVTSAIRSQMISSTAAAPSGKAGTSKEMHQLQRRALERHSSFQKPSVTATYMSNVRAAINDQRSTDAPRRTTRQNASRTLTRIHEDETMSEDELDHTDTVAAPSKPRKKKEAVKKEPKPGYCENCRDRYDDFNEHVESRKHKKFALTQENWTDLDTFLRKLTRR